MSEPGAGRPACPFCGAEESPGAARCWDCQLAFESDHPSPLPETDPEAEVAYELRDWPASARVDLAVSLADRAIAFRWEPGPDLVVGDADEQAVERLLDSAEAAVDDDAERGVDALSEMAGEEWEDDEDDSGEAGLAMGDLFVAADRLMHEPWDDLAGDDLREAVAVVSANRAPFGIGGDVWVKVCELAAVVRDDLDNRADEEVIAQDARALRETLRPLV